MLVLVSVLLVLLLIVHLIHFISSAVFTAFNPHMILTLELWTTREVHVVHWAIVKFTILRILMLLLHLLLVLLLHVHVLIGMHLVRGSFTVLTACDLSVIDELVIGLRCDV